MEALLRICLLLTILIVLRPIDCNISCRDTHDKSVDWYIVYKVPQNASSPHKCVQQGYGYVYMDSNTMSWTLGEVSINETKQPVAYTLQQVKENYGKSLYAAYNDVDPANYEAWDNGHTKAVLNTDKESGFWMIHTIMKFPDHSTLFDTYKFPDDDRPRAQIFLCITLDYKDIDTIGNILMYTYPHVYEYNIPGEFIPGNPTLMDVLLNQSHVSSSPWQKTHTVTSKGGQKFLSLARYKNQSTEIYSTWVAPFYKSDLLVETWLLNGTKLPSNCSSQYKVYNGKEIQIQDIRFSETVDHSKWAVTANSNKTVVCFSNLTRIKEMLNRSGQVICMEIPEVYNAFKNSMKDYEKCPCQKDTGFNEIDNHCL